MLPLQGTGSAILLYGVSRVCPENFQLLTTLTIAPTRRWSCSIINCSPLFIPWTQSHTIAIVSRVESNRFTFAARHTTAGCCWLLLLLVLLLLGAHCWHAQTPAHNIVDTCAERRKRVFAQTTATSFWLGHSTARLGGAVRIGNIGTMYKGEVMEKRAARIDWRNGGWLSGEQQLITVPAGRAFAFIVVRREANKSATGNK